MPDGWAWSRLEPIASLITDYVANGSFASLKANVRTYKEKNYALFVRTVDFANNFKGVDKSFAIQAGREIRVMVVPEQVSDADMILMARDISKAIEAELEYPGQIKVNVIRESRVSDYAK